MMALTRFSFIVQHQMREKNREKERFPASITENSFHIQGFYKACPRPLSLPTSVEKLPYIM